MKTLLDYFIYFNKQKISDIVEACHNSMDP